MPYIQGEASRAKEGRINAEEVGVNRLDPSRAGMDVIAHAYWTLVASDTTEASSTDYVIVATAHSAQVGDVIELTSGTYSGRLLIVHSTATDSFVVAQTLPAALGAGITFDILRSKPARVDTAGAVAVSSLSSLVTFAHTRPSLADSTSDDVIAANASRKAGSYIMNNTGATLWGNYGATAAAANQGFKIGSGQIFIFNTTQAINLFQSSGAPVNVDIFEAT